MKLFYRPFFIILGVVLSLNAVTFTQESSSTVNNNLTQQELLYLQKKEKIRMCVLPNSLPLEEIDSDGKHNGISVEIISIISQYINKPIELYLTKTWTESLNTIEQKKCDILPLAMKIEQRTAYMNFTKAYIHDPFVVITKLNRVFIKDLSALSNKKIGIVNSYAINSILRSKNPSIDFVNVKSSKEGLDKVRNNELFGYIDTLSVAGYLIQKHSLVDLKISGELEFDLNLSIATRNDEPLLHDIMQKALDSISENKIQTIIGKWISIKISRETDYITLWKISAVFIFILFAILYKNRTVNLLNRKLMRLNRVFSEQQKMIDKYVLILKTDLKGIITEVNDAYCKVIGYEEDELIGKTHAIIKHKDMDDEFFKNMWEDIKNDRIWNGEIKNRTKNGETVYFLLNIEPAFKDGKKVGYLSISEDITHKKAIEKLSITDQLTQLYNRHKLEDSFAIEISRAQRYNRSLSTILIDIDYFKSVNDTYGHDVGDEILQSVATILRDNIRLTDLVGRWGGEEFIIIVPDSTLEEARQLAQKIRKVIENYDFKSIGKKTASFGVSTFVLNDTKESFVKKADIALYNAKKQGRNKVVVFK
ncbi:MAG: diguanylate cyclase [Arcobacteraceae bacterium]